MPNQATLLLEATGENQHAVTAVLALIHRRCLADGIEAAAEGPTLRIKRPSTPPTPPIQAPVDLENPEALAELARQLERNRPAAGPDLSWIDDCAGWWSVTGKPDSETRETHPSAARVTAFVLVKIDGGLPFRVSNRLVFSPYQLFKLGPTSFDPAAAQRGQWIELKG